MAMNPTPASAPNFRYSLLGLARRFRQAYGREWGPPTRRDVVGSADHWDDWRGLWMDSRERTGKRYLYGVCRWCLRPCDPKKQWHQQCGKQYQAARGLTRGFYGYLVPQRGASCAVCGGPAEELDHRLALSVGRALGYRQHIRAHLLSNLRWLCEPCHRIKTREDRRTLAVIAATDRMVERLEAGFPLALPAPADPVQRELF